MYGRPHIEPVETDTIITYSRDEFEKCISLNSIYFDNVLDVNGRYYIINVKPVMYHCDYVHCGFDFFCVIHV